MSQLGRIEKRQGRIADLYGTGLSAEAVGRQVGVSGQTVLNDLKALGIRKRSFGPAKGTPRPHADAETIATRRAEVADLYVKGWSSADIGRALGIAAKTARDDLEALGIPRRPPGRQPETPLPDERPCEICGTFFRPRRSQQVRGWGRFDSTECMAKDPKRREASSFSVTRLNLERREQLELLKSEHDLLESHEVAELCGVTVATVTGHYAQKLLEFEKVEALGLPFLLFPRTAVEELVRGWRRGTKQRRWWLVPENVVSVREARGLIAREALELGLSEDDVRAFHRDRVARRRERFPPPRGRPKAGGHPDYHLVWLEQFLIKKAELDAEFNDALELGLVGVGDRRPTSSDAAEAVAEDDFRLHRERWLDYSASRSDPHALDPRFAEPARKRVWQAVKPLLKTEREIATL